MPLASDILSFLFDERIAVNKALFPGFYLSGFECSTFRWKDGQRKNMITTSQHDVQADNDYKILHALGIGGSREGVPWPFVDHHGIYDFSCIDPMVDAMNKYAIVPLWDLCHYGYPDDIDPFSINFAHRFASYCSAFASYVKTKMNGPYFFSPINEITYFSFIGGKWGWVAPYKSDTVSYNHLRLSLCRAAIEGVKAIRRILPAARMIHMDPLVEVVAPHDRPDLKKKAWKESYVDTYLAWDIICGKEYAELGGSPEILDIVGTNNYSVGYMEYTLSGPHKALPKHDRRIVPLSNLLQLVWNRYRRPILISETSGVDENRVSWLRYVTNECLVALNRGVDIQGICLFPAIGSPKWEDDGWVQSGFYNVTKKGDTSERSLYDPYVAELLRWQQRMEHVTMLDDEIKQRSFNMSTISRMAKQMRPKPGRNW